MKKKRMMIAAVALIAAAGMFAQNATRTKKGEEKNFQQGGMPPFQPPKIERPAEADLKAYHDAEAQSYKILLDAQVKAKIVSQEWADARLATLKALQADCKGQCFFFKTSHIFMADQIGRPHFGPRFHKRHHGHNCKPGFDRPRPPAPQDGAVE